MGILRPENARYNSFQEFMALTKEKDNHPSFTNLFSIKFQTPPMMRRGSGQVQSTNMEVEKNDLDWLLDYYADNINLPSKQITTGQYTAVGSAHKYATNSTYSQINITFRIPRSQYTRQFFETWTSMMAPDSEQYTRYYQDYVCPELIIYKYERGGGDYVYTDPKLLRSLREAGDDYLLARKYELTACWKLSNVFPYNIGSVQLDNAASKAMTLQVGFYYERYRFYNKDKFAEAGISDALTIASTNDNYTGPDTSRNSDGFASQVRDLGLGANDLSGTSSGFA